MKQIAQVLESVHILPYARRLGTAERVLLILEARAPDMHPIEFVLEDIEAAGDFPYDGYRPAPEVRLARLRGRLLGLRVRYDHAHGLN